MRSAVLVVLLGCSSASMTSSKGGVTVELSGVTLADDCGGGGRPPPSPTMIASQGGAADSPRGEMAKQASCAKGENCNLGNVGGCDQTSMQLVFKSTEKASVKVKRVELLD